MSAAFVLCTIIVYIVSCAFSSPERSPDCRKFVFAPICRGVAAKRFSNSAPLSNGYIIGTKELTALLKLLGKHHWLAEDARNARWQESYHNALAPATEDD